MSSISYRSYYPSSAYGIGGIAPRKCHGVLEINEALRKDAAVLGESTGLLEEMWDNSPMRCHSQLGKIM